VTRGRRGAGQWRHTPRTSCSTRAASTASAPRVCVLARPGSGQSPLGPPGPRRCGQWAVDALSSSLRGAWGAPSCGLGRTAATRTSARSHAIAQLRRAFAFAPPLPPLPSLSPREEAAPVPGSGLLYSAAQGHVFICTSPSPPFPPKPRHRRLVCQITVFNCTCLSDYLWESGGGAEGAENVASLCKRRKTLSPSKRPQPRVTRTSAGPDSDFAPHDSVGERGRSNSALPAGRHPLGWCGASYLLDPPSPRKSPRGVFRVEGQS
jgi:hypothetical protein